MTSGKANEPGFDAIYPHSRGGRGDSSVKGERRLATILFCDVQCSTTMAEQLDPEEWAEVMDETYDFLIAPVVRYGGTVARRMGDGILAIFGAPVTHEDGAQRTILAGLDILEGIRPFQDRFQSDYRMNFELRVGVNTGMVVVGEVGSDLAAEWTAMGDAVNLAARMEQTAAPGTLQVSEDTYRLVSPVFEFEPLGEIEVKGKRSLVKAYKVLTAKGKPGRLRGIPGLNTPLIGRAKELQALHQVLDQLRQGWGGIVCLIGEAGLGKSRLIEELQEAWLRERGEAGWIEGRGISYEASRPYGLFRQYLYNLKGKTLLRSGRVSEGIQVLEKACRMAKLAGARRAGWMTLPNLLGAYREQQDDERAEAARVQLEELSDFLLGQIEDGDLRSKFLRQLNTLTGALPTN